MPPSFVSQYSPARKKNLKLPDGIGVRIYYENTPNTQISVACFLVEYEKGKEIAFKFDQEIYEKLNSDNETVKKETANSVVRYAKKIVSDYNKEGREIPTKGVQSMRFDDYTKEYKLTKHKDRESMYSIT